jgi:hypothetical protein
VWPAALLALARLRRADAATAEALPAPAAVPGKGRRSPGTLEPTPDCDDDEPTPVETEGPFFKPRSPLRATLIDSGASGTRIVLTGRVVSSACRPVAGALLDFWHADDAGEYDNDGFRCRGHQYADARGRYRLETVVPGLYPGRTRHFHVKVQAPHGKVVTTQLYFPGEPRNARDGLFRSDLLMTVRTAGHSTHSKGAGNAKAAKGAKGVRGARGALGATDAMDATFDFVVRTG